MFRLTDPSGALRPASLPLASLAVSAVAVAAIALGAGRPAAPASAAASVAPAPTQSAAAANDPTPTPIVTPRPSIAPSPENEGQDAIPLAVELDTFDGHAVNVDVVDRTGSITRAVSGHPADGMSVDGYSLKVENVDARTLRLTWIDFPIDNRLALFVDDVDGHLRLVLVQPEPTGPTDAIGFDRELLLTFDRPIDAATVEAILQDGLDTAG